MALIKSGQSWKFRTESYLEEVVWRNLPKLLNLKPLHRQFSVDGKFCDLLAVDKADRLVIVELKNVEDHYVVQQLVRYYDVIARTESLPFDVDITNPRLLAIAPSFHADTLLDCQYCTLPIELLTFSIQPSTSGRLTLMLSDDTGKAVSTLALPKPLQTSQTDIQITAPPRKLLNWLSRVHELEHAWILALRQQLLGADARMKEIVEPNRIFYGKGKSKLCCELKKIRASEYRGEGIDCCLWLPDPENNPHVIKLLVLIDFKRQQVTTMYYGKKGYKSGNPWHFPDCIERMKTFGYQRALKQYQPFLSANMAISSTKIVELALQTWHNRL